MDFYNYRVDVYAYFQHTFMFKQLVKWILYPFKNKLRYIFITIFNYSWMYLKKEQLDQ